MKRWCCALLCAVLILGLAACGGAPAQPIQDAVRARGGYYIRAAVLYDGAGDSVGWQNTLDYLAQALTLNLTADGVDAARPYDLSEYDVVYADNSLLGRADLASAAENLIAFVEQGGYLMLPNGFAEAVPADFLGASVVVKLDGFPRSPESGSRAADYAGLESLILDFHGLYGEFFDAEALTGFDYGVGLKAKGADVLVKSGGTALYTMNHYGKGCVFFTNPLLPSEYSKASFSLRYDTDYDTSFSNTTASCNQLLLSRFAAYAAKNIYGFAINRVFGNYGSPAMSWELHYEDMEAYEHDSLGTFAPICEENNQIPSISLVRSTYVWFEQAETLGYLLNNAGDGGLDFSMDLWENAYSSGTHIAAGDVWLQLNALNNCVSYFGDNLAENYRLYPCITDYDGNGIPDAFCGSVDGKVYYFAGKGMTGLDGRFCTEEAVCVEGAAVSGFSAPQLLDVDGDGVQDLLIGGEDGTISWFRGEGGLSFAPQGVLIDTGIAGQVLPAAGDLNGDGIVDLAVGSDQSALVLYYGAAEGRGVRFGDGQALALAEALPALYTFWLAPCIADYDGDGAADLVIGTYEGYVALFYGDGHGGYSFDRFIDCDEMNIRGNYHVKFGHFCTPTLTDLDGNGSLDLLCGFEEYGMAYPIDCAYFPLRQQLQEQIDFARARDYYIGVHFLTGDYASPERERYELEAQLEALAGYGLTGLQGVNQHTWRMSGFDEMQSLASIYNAGLLWQSGYAPSRTTRPEPQVAKENVIVLPFWLMDGGERTLLVQNCSVLPYLDEHYTDISARYGMPVFVYYHCDRIFLSEDGPRSAVETVETFRRRHGYNFVKEDQLMYAIAAAYNFDVDVTPLDDGISVAAVTKDTDFALYDPACQAAVGIEVEFAGSTGKSYTTDASVWCRRGSSLTLGLDQPAAIRRGSAGTGAHLLRVNLPAEITRTGDGAALAFLDGGMMQATVSGRAETEDTGWKTEFDGSSTTFTRFGAAETLHIRY